MGGAVFYELQKFGVDAGVVGELRMEGCGHHSSLPDEHGIVAAFGQNFDAIAYLLDTRGADEDHLQR